MAPHHEADELAALREQVDALRQGDLASINPLGQTNSRSVKQVFRRFREPRFRCNRDNALLLPHVATNGRRYRRAALGGKRVEFGLALRRATGQAEDCGQQDARSVCSNIATINVPVGKDGNIPGTAQPDAGNPRARKAFPRYGPAPALSGPHNGRWENADGNCRRPR